MSDEPDFAFNPIAGWDKNPPNKAPYSETTGNTKIGPRRKHGKT